MSENKGLEYSSVQKPMIKYASAIGWDPVSQADALSLRKGEGGLLFYRILEEKLIELNPGLINKDNVYEVIGKIESVSNNIEGNAEILSWMRGEKSIYDSKEKRERNVTVIDFSTQALKNNLFQVTEEWQYGNAKEKNRADIIFLINGIPVAIVENKSAKKEKGIEEALIQIREYHHETPEMLTMPQVFDITHLIDFFYGATWSLGRKNIFNWKDEEKGNFEVKIKKFFNRERFLKMLKEWILFYLKDDELQKSILRQHQSRAVEKIVARCADSGKKTGLIWHTQGSGKTFTMIIAAKHILEQKDIFSKGTVILMIDRNELEGQLSGWIARILGELKTFDIKIEPATSKKRLQELLKADFRGLIISMIHKFDKIPKAINSRDNIFVLMDEAHRSVGGDFGNYLLGALPNATLIGFTGTPIDKTAYGKGTFKIFGKEDDKGYLDKYSITESIEDGTTLPLKYTLAPNEIRVDSELLEKEFLNLVEAEGVSDFDELTKILDNAVNIKAFLKSPDRIEKVSKFVANHFKENVEPLGYKAFLVAVDREACALYKEALDKIVPADYSVPVYTSAQHDSERYPLVYKHQISDEKEKQTRKLFLKNDLKPKILIVTDKLLTGFDAPILYSMYLDKPMRDHVLLQAIARVNRPYEINDTVKKPCGLVVDFVGIFEKLEKALAFDSDVVSGVIENLDILFNRFKKLISEDAKPHIELLKGEIDDKTIEKAIDAFSDKNKREALYKLYKEIETLYEILSPSSKLREYIAPFKRLAILYRIIKNAYRNKPVFYDDIARKTSLLVRDNVSVSGLDNTMNIVKIDQNTLKAIKENQSSDNNKIINLINTIRKTVEEESGDSPYLIPIGERAENIREQYDGRQCSTKEALKSIEQLIQDIIISKKEQAEKGMDSNTFTIFWILKHEKINNPESVAYAVNSIFMRFPNYNFNIEEMRQLKAELYRILLSAVGKGKMFSIVGKLLKINEKK
ncbi:MAG: deoxyribonuclease HsdR [Elusimicrobia bacterium HGW-Elusimicrobia-2]|nr:MAG: deoxyribonuclease HsdR [Elusimicrobia bacterium HGW-Elusimicrobia-2]